MNSRKKLLDDVILLKVLNIQPKKNFLNFFKNLTDNSIRSNGVQGIINKSINFLKFSLLVPPLSLSFFLSFDLSLVFISNSCLLLCKQKLVLLAKFDNEFRPLVDWF